MNHADEMPERPRNHVVGSKAVRAFVNAMPEEWVIREPGDDYGIDLEVEVFTGGKATGLSFKVQSKGTDKAGSSKRTVKRKSLNYWRRLDVPVLIVLWDKTLGSPRYRWAHTLGVEKALDPQHKTLTVRFDPAHEVDGKFVGGVQEYLEAYRNLSRGDVEPPLRFVVEVTDNSKADKASVRAEVQRLLSRAGNPSPFRLEPASVTTRPTNSALLRVTRDRIAARTPLDLSSASMVVPDGVADYDPQTLASDLVVLAAAAMAAVNPEIAAMLAETAGPGSAVWFDAEMAHRLAPAVAHPRETRLLSGVLALLHGVEQASVAYDVFLMYGQASIERMEDDDFERMSASMKDDLDTALEEAADLPEDKQAGVLADVGRRYFNLASMHRRHRDWTGSLECLDQAAKLEPRYSTDPLFQEFVASCAWNKGDFDRCATAYATALDLGSRDGERLSALYPDALFRAGRFKAASQALATWTETGSWFDRVPIIDTLLLDFVHDYLELDDQELNPLTADDWDKLTTGGTVFLTEEEARDVLRTRSAFEPGLWTAVAAHRDLAGGFLPVLMAAVLTDNDVMLWVVSALAALRSGQPQAVLNAIVDAALFATANEFYDAVSALAVPPDETDMADDAPDASAGNGVDPLTEDPAIEDGTVPPGAPALVINTEAVREHMSSLAQLAGRRMELVPSVGTDHQVRFVNSDDATQPLVQRSL